MVKDINDPFSIQIKGGKIKDRKIDSQDKFSSDDGFVMTDDDSAVQMGPAIESYNLRIALFFLFIVFLILAGRIFFLQIIQGETYRDLAEGNRIRLQTIKANRGIIYDINGQQMVRNVPSFSVQFISPDLPKDKIELNIILSEIAKITEVDLNELNNIVIASPAFSYLPVNLVENVIYEDAINLRIQADNWSGIHIVEIAKREYMLGNSFSHILGYLGKLTESEYSATTNDYELIDYIGKSGIEKEHETELRGIVGKKQIEVDFLGKETKIIAEQQAITGDNIYLYIDADMQIKLSEIISKTLRAKHLSKAAAVIINPKNGGIISMVSFPEYDNNIFSRTISQTEYETLFTQTDKPLFNRSISGQYPPGSVIKPLLATSALQEDIINRWTSFNSTGGIYYDIWFFPDWKSGGHGQTNVVKALAESVNTFFYIIGIEEYDGNTGLGLDRMLSYMKSYGLGKSTGVDLLGESSGFLPDRYWKWDERNEPWYPGDTMHLAIGQGDILVTPIQMANYIAAIANNGTLFSPQLVQKTIDSQDGVVIMSTPLILNENFVAKENIDIVKTGMREAVLSGSARYINSAYYQAAGKTGTAQVGNNVQSHSWFVGFAPYDDPTIAWAVLVENGGEGSEVSVPIMKEFLDWYFIR